jgi:hypothetical protein
VSAVTEAEAASDRAWFVDHPRRRYRLRRSASGVCLIRRRSGGVLLRTHADDLPRFVPDADTALRAAWIDAAWRDLSPMLRAALLKEIKKGERLHVL